MHEFDVRVPFTRAKSHADAHSRKPVVVVVASHARVCRSTASEGSKREGTGPARSWNGTTYQNDYLSLPFTLIDKSCYVNECSGRGGPAGEGSVRSRATGWPRKDNEEIENLAVMRPVS